MKLVLPKGVKSYNVNETLNRNLHIYRITELLKTMGYREIYVPTIMPKELFASCTEGTENRMFELSDKDVLIPEVTNYIKAVGARSLGTNKVYYVARCFRAETSTDATRLREFTQIGVEYLGDNSLDCVKVVRKDAITVIGSVLAETTWKLEDGAKRGLNLYNSDKTFEIHSYTPEPYGPAATKQLLGGGPYDGGAGWALGLERLMWALEQ